MADIRRIDSPTDPERCQSADKLGQCDKKSVEDSEYCQIHGGNKSTQRNERERISNYRLAKMQVRLQEQVANPSVKNLRDEIGILRMVMEETLNNCQNDFDLLTNSQRIGNLVIQITTVVEKCHKLEGSMGQLLDKTTVLQMANTFINIIIEENLPEATLDRIACKIMESVAGE